MTNRLRKASLNGPYRCGPLSVDGEGRWRPTRSPLGESTRCGSNPGRARQRLLEVSDHPAQRRQYRYRGAARMSGVERQPGHVVGGSGNSRCSRSSVRCTALGARHLTWASMVAQSQRAETPGLIVVKSIRRTSSIAGSDARSRTRKEEASPHTASPTSGPRLAVHDRRSRDGSRPGPCRIRRAWLTGTLSSASPCKHIHSMRAKVPHQGERIAGIVARATSCSSVLACSRRLAPGIGPHADPPRAGSDHREPVGQGHAHVPGTVSPHRVSGQ